jgi:hypothetical protein
MFTGRAAFFHQLTFPPLFIELVSPNPHALQWPLLFSLLASLHGLSVETWRAQQAGQSSKATAAADPTYPLPRAVLVLLRWASGAARRAPPPFAQLYHHHWQASSYTSARLKGRLGSCLAGRAVWRGSANSLSCYAAAYARLRRRGRYGSAPPLRRLPLPRWMRVWCTVRWARMQADCWRRPPRRKELTRIVALS